jgi:hypothetical protein
MNYNTISQIAEDWEISIAETLGQIEEIRELWTKMQSNEPVPAFDADIDRYLSDIKTKKDSAAPYIITLSLNGEPAAMIIAQIAMRHVYINLGYKTFFRPKMKCLAITYGGILGRKDNETCSVIMRVLLRQLHEKKVSMIYFNHLGKNSCLYRLSRNTPGFLSRSYFPKCEKHWQMSAPENMEQFFQSLSQKHRANLKRYRRKFEQEYEGRFKIAIYSSEVDLDEGIKAAEKISRNTYQWGLGFGFRDDSVNRTLLTTGAKMGWLRLHILYIDSEPCAFENWIRYDKKYFGHGIGFDPKWKSWRIGTVLFLNTLEYVCRDNSIETIDFGFGDAEYKQSYGSNSWDEVSVYIFASRIYPILVNILRTCFAAADSALKYAAHKFGLINQVKRLWRNRIAQQASKETTA